MTQVSLLATYSHEALTMGMRSVDTLASGSETDFLLRISASERALQNLGSLIERFLALSTSPQKSKTIPPQAA